MTSPLKSLLKALAVLLLCAGMIAVALPAMAQSKPHPPGGNPPPPPPPPPPPVPPPNTPPGNLMPSIIIDPSKYLDSGSGSGAAPPPTGVVTGDGVAIMPADVNGKMTREQMETIRRMEQQKASRGILENPSPAFGIDANGNGAVVSGASIR